MKPNQTSAGTPLSPPPCSALHVCHCGTGAITPHTIGGQGCVRTMEASPQPLGNDPDTGIEMWIVEGQIITAYTMRQQRGYHQHPCGCWSRWPGSTNSLPDET